MERYGNFLLCILYIIVAVVTWFGLWVHFPSTTNLNWKTPSEGRSIAPSNTPLDLGGEFVHTGSTNIT